MGFYVPMVLPNHFCVSTGEARISNMPLVSCATLGDYVLCPKAMGGWGRLALCSLGPALQCGDLSFVDSVILPFASFPVSALHLFLPSDLLMLIFMLHSHPISFPFIHLEHIPRQGLSCQTINE